MVWQYICSVGIVKWFDIIDEGIRAGQGREPLMSPSICSHADAGGTLFIFFVFVMGI